MCLVSSPAGFFWYDFGVSMCSCISVYFGKFIDGISWWARISYSMPCGLWGWGGCLPAQWGIHPASASALRMEQIAVLWSHSGEGPAWKSQFHGMWRSTVQRTGWAPQNCSRGRHLSPLDLSSVRKWHHPDHVAISSVISPAWPSLLRSNCRTLMQFPW